MLHPERLPAGGALLVANHVSWLDPIVLLVAVHRIGRRRLRFVALPSMFDAPVSGWFLRKGRHIPARTGNGARTTLKDAVGALREGELVLLYPEGAIPRAGQLLPAQPGVGIIAERAGVPVVPVATRGFERRRRWYAGRRHGVLVIGEPVTVVTSGSRRDRQLALSDAALEHVRALERGLTRQPHGAAD